MLLLVSYEITMAKLEVTSQGWFDLDFHLLQAERGIIEFITCPKIKFIRTVRNWMRNEILLSKYLAWPRHSNRQASPIFLLARVDTYPSYTLFLHLGPFPRTSPSSCRQHHLLLTSLHCVTTQKTAIWMFIALKTSSVTWPRHSDCSPQKMYCTRPVDSLRKNVFTYFVVARKSFTKVRPDLFYLFQNHYQSYYPLYRFISSQAMFLNILISSFHCFSIFRVVIFQDISHYISVLSLSTTRNICPYNLGFLNNYTDNNRTA
jgi:hypothetical protein